MTPASAEPAGEREYWLCPNTPRCPHSADVHETEDQYVGAFTCCVRGCPYGRPGSAEPTEGERMTAIIQAADNLSFMVTSYLLGDLDAATVQRALEAYSAARMQEVPF